MIKIVTRKLTSIGKHFKEMRGMIWKGFSINTESLFGRKSLGVIPWGSRKHLDVKSVKVNTRLRILSNRDVPLFCRGLNFSPGWVGLHHLFFRLSQHFIGIIHDSDSRHAGSQAVNFPILHFWSKLRKLLPALPHRCQ